MTRSCPLRAHSGLTLSLSAAFYEEIVLAFGLISGVGRISFGRALSCGLLITAITCICYVISWEIVYYNFMPHYMDSYFAAQVRQAQTSGLDPATTTARIAAIRHSQQRYQNPLINMAYTLIEPLPVGVVITLVSAALLQRKEPLSTSSPATSVA